MHGRVAALVAAGLVALVATPGAAQNRAPPAVCAAKLAQIRTGQSIDSAADVEWLSNYCDPASRDAAISAIGEAAMNAGIDDTVAASREAARQARAGMAAAHSQAAGASAQAVVGIVGDGLGGIVISPGEHHEGGDHHEGREHHEGRPQGERRPDMPRPPPRTTAP